MDFKCFIENSFGFLVKEYNLKSCYQVFDHCFDGNRRVYTYSFYNDGGCFTIHNLPQRGELDFYYAKHFSHDRKALCEKVIDVSVVEKSIWQKNSKVLGFKNPFFWRSGKRVLCTLAEVIRRQIESRGEFFGIKVN